MYKKSTLCILLLFLFSCKQNDNQDATINDTIVPTDSVQTAIPNETKKEDLEELSNERFRKVTIEKIGEHKFRVKGQAQVFEATINWSVEDGHYILKEGFVTADVGAPEWGTFDFTFEVKKAEENSSLTLILFEISAKDGNQQHELPVHVPYN